MSSASVVIVALVLGFFCAVPLASAGTCWDASSRCSGWSSAATGFLWLSCDNCCKCKGFASGTCNRVRVYDCILTKYAYRCVCSGTRVGPKPSVCSGMSNAAFSCE